MLSGPKTYLDSRTATLAYEKTPSPNPTNPGCIGIRKRAGKIMPLPPNVSLVQYVTKPYIRARNSEQEMAG